MRRLQRFLLVLATAAIAAAPAGAAVSGGVYSIDPISVDGGGHPSSGGVYSDWAASEGHISATLLSGGVYTAKSGYVAQLRGLTGGATGPNATPTLDPIANRTIAEDSGVLRVPMTGITDGGDFPAQNLTITALSSDLSVLLNPTVVYSPGSATGSLWMAPLADANGVVTITVKIQDDGAPNAFITRSFTVTVTPVNDAPTVNTPPDLVINENAAQQSVPLSGISAGGGSDELAQTVTVTGISSDTTVIANPSVLYSSGSATGTLLFTPNANAYGTVTILLRVADNGGTANGGANVAFRSFTVQINHVSIPPVLQTMAPNMTMQNTTSAVIQTSNLQTTDDLPTSQVTYVLTSAPSPPRGQLRARGSVVNVNGTFTQADIDAGLVNFVDSGSGATTITFGIRAHDGETPVNFWTNGGGATLPAQTFTVNITSGVVLNNAPQITLPSASPTYTEGDAPLVVDAGATITDAENNIGGGRLTASLGNGTVNDRLSVRNTGVGAGQIGLSGSNVTYGGSLLGVIDTTNNGVGLAPLQIDLVAGADQAWVQALLRSLTYSNVSNNPNTTARQFQLVVRDGPGLTSNLATKQINVVAVNSAPTVLWSKAGTSYTEGTAAVVVDTGSLVQDQDSPTLTGGLMSLAFVANGTATDQLTIWNEGVGVGQISTNSATQQVFYAGALFGTYSGGGNGTALQIVFTTAAATPSAVQALLQHVQFANTSQNPSTLSRLLQVTVSDGPAGGSTATSIPQQISIAVQPVDNAPVVTMGGANPVDWSKGTPPDPLPLDASTTVTDTDSTNFNGGALIVSFSSGSLAGDEVVIVPEGSGAGQIDVVGTTVRYGGVAIGTVSGIATMNGPMLVQFNSAAATPAAAQELARCLAFTNVSPNPSNSPPDRVVDVVVLDGAGGTSATASKTVRVHNTDLAPVVAINAGPVGYTEQAGAVFVDAPQGSTVTDGDSADFSGGMLTVSYASGSHAEDQLVVKSIGSGAGQIGVAAPTAGHVFDVQYGGNTIGYVSAGSDGSNGTDLVVTFNSAFATPAAAQALLRVIEYDNTSRNPVTAPRDVQVVVNDGDGAASVARHVIISITAIDDPPVVAVGFTLGTIAGVSAIYDMADATQPFATDVDTAVGSLAFSIPPNGVAPAYPVATANGQVDLVYPDNDTTLAPLPNQVRYTPNAGFSGDDSFPFTVADATTTVAGTAIVHVTKRLDEARPHVVTDGAREAFDGDPYAYALRVTNEPGQGAVNCVFRLTGNVPSGMTLTRISGTAATIGWAASTATATGTSVGGVHTVGVIGDHYEFGVLFTDQSTHKTGYQPLEFLLRTPPVGGG